MELKAHQTAAFLAKPDPNIRGFLIYGPNGAAAREAAARLARWALGPDADPFAETILYEADLQRNASRLGDALEAQSLLGGTSLVRVRIQGDAMADGLLANAAILGKGPGSYATLLVEAEELAKTSKIRQAFEKSPHLVALPFYEDGEQDLLNMARARLKAAGIAMDRAAMEQFAALMPQDRGLMNNEIDTLIAFSGPERAAIDAGEITALLAADGENDVHDAGQSALLGHGADAALALSDLVGFAGVSALRALETRLLRLHEAQILIAGGLSARDAGKRLRPPLFWKEIDSFEAQLRIWKPALLAAALDVVWRAQLRAMTAGAPQELIAVSTFRIVAGIAARRK